MNVKHKISYSFLLVIFILNIQCTNKVNPKVSFVVSTETKPEIWEHTTQPGAGDEEYYFRKLKPGDLLYYSPLIMSKTNGKAGIPPIFFTPVLPIRLLGKIGQLKDYEKSFMLAIMGTNTRGQHEKNTSDNDMKTLWNYTMNHLYCVKAKQQTGFFRVMIDFSQISQLKLDDDNLVKLLPGDVFRDMVLARGNDSTIYNYFFKGNKSPTNTNFYVPASDVIPFSFISYTVHFNRYNYDNRGEISLLDLWSVYDWINSGVDLPGMKDGKKNIKTLIFEFHPSRLKVVPDTLSTGDEYKVEYKIDQDYIFLYPGSKRRIKESDLVDIHPSSVRRMKFKK